MSLVITNCAQSLPIEALVDAYKAFLSGVREHTFRAKFYYDLPLFVDFLHKHTKAALLRDATRGLVEAFVDSRLAVESPATAVRRLATVKTFLKWAAQSQGLMNPVEGIGEPTMAAHDAQCLTPEELTALRAMAGRNGRNAFEARRNICLVDLLALAGLRAEEARRLTASNLAPDLSRLSRINGKGRHYRDLPCPAALVDTLRGYLSEREVRLRELRRGYSRLAEPIRQRFPLLITSLRPEGNAPEAFALGSKTIWRIVATAGARAGIPHAHPHLLRHTFAHRLMAKTHDITTVARALGHRRVQSTVIYTAPTWGQLEEAMR